jgi:hypothetical protein
VRSRRSRICLSFFYLLLSYGTSRKSLIAVSLLLAHKFWGFSGENTPDAPYYWCASSKLCGSRRPAPKVCPENYPSCTTTWCARGKSLHPPLEPACGIHPQLSLAHQR